MLRLPWQLACAIDSSIDEEFADVLNSNQSHRFDDELRPTSKQGNWRG
jgi:hypothetical protein